MYGKRRPMAILLVFLISCVVLMTLSVPDNHGDLDKGTVVRKYCIRQSTDPAAKNTSGFFSVEENARFPSGSGLIRLQRGKSDFFRMAILYSFSLILSVRLFLWNQLKHRSEFGLDICLHPRLRYLLELLTRKKKDGKKRVFVPVFG